MNPMSSTLLEGAMPGLLMAALMLAVLPWLDRESRWRILPIIVVEVYTARYLHWRVTETIPSPENLVNFTFGVAFFLIELLAAMASIISYITLSRTKNRSAEVDANLGWLLGMNRKPLIDVFICTVNEEKEILERTMLGAVGMTYPNYRVWVLDDGRRPWLEALAKEYGCNYLTRPDNDHAKAGNLNHALRHVNNLETPPDFISVLDADFVPTPVFLVRAVALFRDNSVGIVQTPQHFINPDPIQANLQASDAWPDEQRYFFDVLLPAKDAWGTAFCCGTSSVIRMSALKQIGGFATESVTEDYLLTIRMKRNGLRTVYLNERLSLGLAPEGLNEYVTQRSRWCLGFFQIIRSGDGPFQLNNGLAFMDRVSLFESMFYWSGTYAFRVAGILIPILYLLFGIHAVNVGTVDGLAHFLPYYLSQVVVMAWLSGQRVLPIMTDVTQLIAAREILAGVFVGLFRPKGQKFRVTAKGGDRSKTVVQWQMLGIFGILLALTLAGIMHAFGGNKTLQDSSIVALYWSWYNILILIAAIMVCVEKPRFRRNERLKSGNQVSLTVGSQTHMFQTADVSVGGMRLLGQIHVPIGTPVTVELDGTNVNAEIARSTDRDFAVRIEDTPVSRAAMVRHVYSGGYETTVRKIDYKTVARRLATRMAQ